MSMIDRWKDRQMHSLTEGSVDRYIEGKAKDRKID